MKKFIWILLLSTLFLHSQNLIYTINYAHIKSGGVFDENGTSEFKPVPLIPNKQTGAYLKIPANESYWIGYSFLEPHKEGEIYVTLLDLEVDLHGLLPLFPQSGFSLDGMRGYSFEYKKGDSLIHTIHIKPQPFDQYLYGIGVTDEETFFTIYKRETLRKAFLFFVLGMLVMATFYALILWIYLKEKLYGSYALMQMGFVFYLLTYPPIARILSCCRYDPFYFWVASGLTLLASILFVRSFLQTKTYARWADKVLIFLFVSSLLAIIATFYGYPHGLLYFTPFVLFYVVAGIVRLKQGFVPARFFIVGWSILLSAIIAAEFLKIGNVWFVPLAFIAIPFEAIMMLFAIGYLLKEIKEEGQKNKITLLHQSKFASIGEAMGQLAHQWKNPLNTISYMLLYIQKEARDEPIRSKATKALWHIEHLSDTVVSFLDFYRTKQKEKIALKDEVSQVIHFLAYNAQREDIALKVIGDCEECIEGDRNALRHILLNLVTNAIEAYHTNPQLPDKNITIEIACKKINIIDNAGGVDKEMQKELFEPYVTNKLHGSGMGLAMSRQMAEELLDASLDFVGLEGGSCFSLSW